MFDEGFATGDESRRRRAVRPRPRRAPVRPGGPRRPRRSQHVKEAIRDVHGTAPDIAFTIEDAVESGDTIWVRARGRGHGDRTVLRATERTAGRLHGRRHRADRRRPDRRALGRARPVRDARPDGRARPAGLTWRTEWPGGWIPAATTPRDAPSRPRRPAPRCSRPLATCSSAQGYAATTVADIARAAPGGRRHGLRHRRHASPRCCGRCWRRRSPAPTRRSRRASATTSPVSAPPPPPGTRSRAYVAGSSRSSPGSRRSILAIRDAAGADAESAALWEEIADRRAANMRRFAADLRTTGELRADLSDDDVADIVWSMNGPEYWVLLVGERGWSHRALRRPTSSTPGAGLLLALGRSRSNMIRSAWSARAAGTGPPPGRWAALFETPRRGRATTGGCSARRS